jgi:hypothetical protein
VDRTGLAEFLRHPEVGLLTLHCQVLLDPDQSPVAAGLHRDPGTESHEKLQLLTVIGLQNLSV